MSGVVGDVEAQALAALGAAREEVARLDAELVIEREKLGNLRETMTRQGSDFVAASLQAAKLAEDPEEAVKAVARALRSARAVPAKASDLSVERLAQEVLESLALSLASAKEAASEGEPEDDETAATIS